MSKNYNENYSMPAITKILLRLRACVMCDKISLSLNPNRQENISFVREYRLDICRVKEILLAIAENEREAELH